MISDIGGLSERYIHNNAEIVVVFTNKTHAEPVQDIVVH